MLKKYPEYDYYEITDKKPVGKYCELKLLSRVQERNGTKRNTEKKM
jgi:hypothetical protein